MSEAVPINKIIPLSTVDGPGCRTSIFVQGCNIGCVYCHNPETQNVCRDCGLCVPGCPSGALTINAERKVEWSPSRCQECDQCIKICPFHASPRVRVMTPAQVMDEVMPQRPFIRGITLSGGECTLYPKFLTELLTLAKAQGLTTLLDFNGVVDLSQQPELMSVTDGVMMDIKAWNPGVFQQLTGVKTGTHMKENLAWLAGRGQLEELRLVCVDGHVDTETCLHGVARAIPNHLADTKLKLIAFRNHGVRGALADAPPMPSATMQTYATLARELGFQHVDIR